MCFFLKFFCIEFEYVVFLDIQLEKCTDDFILSLPVTVAADFHITQNIVAVFGADGFVEKN